MQRAEDAFKEDSDLALLSHWIAFNALYGQWSAERKETLPDNASWKGFIERIHKIDNEGTIEEVLSSNKRLVMKIFEDEYLSRFFWADPSEKRAGQSKQIMYDSQTWFLQRKWLLIMDRLLERIYLLRCQLVHGAATYNSSLNRIAIRHCYLALDHLLRAILQVWIKWGVDEDWGVLCYPPLRDTNRRRDRR